MSSLTPNINLKIVSDSDNIDQQPYNDNSIIIDNQIATVKNDIVTANLRIDSAILATHTHANKPVIDKLSEDVSGRPLYNGTLIGVSSDIWGGEYSTYHNLSTAIALSFGTNYVVTADENHSGQRTYYSYLQNGTLQYVGTFSDGTSTGGITGGGTVSSAQWSSSSNIVAGSVKLFAVSNNPTFSFVGPTVLKEELGKSDVVTTVNEFDNGEASSFKFDPEFVQFNGGKMQVKTNYLLPFTTVLPSGDSCGYAICTIDLLTYKTIESVVI